MPRLSIYRPEKGKDYKFFDRNIKELFQVGGTDIYVHKYMGPHDQGETNDATQPRRAVIDHMSIQDLLFLENRDRKYESDVYSARGIYSVTDADFDLTQFGLFMQNDQPFITFHQLDMVERLGRRLMSGDVLELPHRKDDYSLDPDMDETLKRFYQVEDVNVTAEGFSQTWWPHLIRARCKPLRDSPEFRDIIGTRNDEESIAYKQGTGRRDQEINDAIIAQAESDAPESGYNTQPLYVLPVDDNGKIALVTADETDIDMSTGKMKADRVKASPRGDGYLQGYLTADGIAPNGESYDFGTSFPTAPIEGSYHLRTDYLPNRLFRYDGRRWVHQEDDVKMTMTNLDSRKTSKMSFVNNTNITTNKDGTTLNEKSALSQALIDKERKTPTEDTDTTT